MFDCPMKIFIAFFGSYLFASVVFFKNPTLLHTKKKQRFTCRHISHRGGAGEGYENTISSFRRAISVGTDMLEMDCHLTKDSKVVVSHDHNLFRSTGLDCNISQLNYKDLPLLNPSLSLDFDPGKIFEGSGTEEERKIPLLSEVFKNFPNIPINIDIKENNTRLVEEVDKLIRDYKREDYTVWGNFSEAITRKCYEQNPNICLLFSMRRVVYLLLLFYSGLLPFIPLKETHLEIFLPSIFLRRMKKEPGSDAILPLPNLLLRLMELLLMRKALFQHLQKRGIETYIWVLNYEEEYKRAIELGATGIMTDYPTKLKRFLQDHPEYATGKN